MVRPLSRLSAQIQINMKHQVAKGDTLFSIARKYNITPHKLVQLNQLPANATLSIGQELLVSEEEKTPSGKISHYTVQPGDTLFGIARKFNLTPGKILELNQLPTGATISVGQRLAVSEAGLEALAQPYADRQQEQDLTTAKYHTVVSGESLWVIARKYDVSPSDLRKWNNLSSYQLTVGQELRVSEGGQAAPNDSAAAATPTPQQSSSEFHIAGRGESLWAIARKYNLTTARLRQLNNLSPQATISQGQKIWLKAQHPAEDLNRQPSQSKAAYHTVGRGETLFSISRQYDLKPNELLQINGLPANHSLYIGQELRVKKLEVAKATSETSRYTVEKGDSLFSIARRFSLSVQQLRELNGLAPSAGLSVGQSLKVVPDADEVSHSTVYKVRNGESLREIAQRNRTSEQELMQANNLKNDRVQGGQSIVVPQPSMPSVPVQYRDKARAIMEARKQFTLIKHNGQAALATGLSGPVGKVSAMSAQDVDKVQQALIAHDLLQTAHGENPRSPSVSAAQIPKTINALLKFQQVYRVNYFQNPTATWQKLFPNQPMFDDPSFTAGTVKSGDLTFRMLRDLTRYELTLPNPQGGQIKASFRNFVVSSFTVEPMGISYHGQVTADTIPLSLFKSLGLNDTMAEALKIVSSHEGNLDAINTYDKAWFSYGFIQFAGSSVNGPLGQVIGTMKLREPQLFEEYFGQFGIDVLPEMRDGKVFKGQMQLFDINNQDGVWEKQGVAADKAIAADKLLYGCFIRAAFEPRLAACQVVGAVDGYVKYALKAKIDLDVPGAQIRDAQMTDYINSPLGLAVMVDVTVNQWITKMAAYFKTAIEAVASQMGIAGEAQLRNIDEQRVIQYLADHAPDPRTQKRAASMLKSGLSARKAPGSAVLS